MGEHMTDKTLEIIEEIDGDEQTGVELERQMDDAEGSDVIRPWDPTTIRVDTKPYSLRNIVDMVKEGDLELAPDFQRKKVWGPVQKSRLIESILLRIPLPAFYFSSDEQGLLQVVDGLQRLSTINDFVNGRFVLNGLEYLQKDVGGKRFDTLPAIWSRRVYSTQIIANVVDPQTPDQVKFDIFKRINTGGSPLNAQEIRHCMSKKRSRDFIHRLVSRPEFRLATSEKLQDHPRMVDREVVLRFAAFRWNRAEYSKYDTLDSFLTDLTKQIDSGKINDNQLQKLEDGFVKAMKNAWLLFEAHAFRKWDKFSDRLNPFNRALFDTWSVLLADYEWEQLKPFKEVIVSSSRQLMSNNIAFLNAITTSTNMTSRIDDRFSAIDAILKEHVHQ
jgi:hypothetical protein